MFAPTLPQENTLADAAQMQMLIDKMDELINARRR
jgi:hypothetical protein